MITRLPWPFVAGALVAALGAVAAGEKLTYEQCVEPGIDGLWSVMWPLIAAAALAGFAVAAAGLRERGRSRVRGIALAVGAFFVGGAAFGVVVFGFVFFVLGVCLR